MNLLHRVVAHLEGRGVATALIGGGALAVHGIARTTEDLDLLVLDVVVLDEGFWDSPRESMKVEIRRGDGDDPLAGVVRCADGETAVDVVVGKGAWMKDVLARRIRLTLEGSSCPVVDAADLVLLKLDAGGPQDILDVRLLLAHDGARLRAEVERRMAGLPHGITTLWEGGLRPGGAT